MADQPNGREYIIADFTTQVDPAAGLFLNVLPVRVIEVVIC